MKIYQAVTSPFAVRVHIAAYAKGLSLEFVAPPDGMGSEAYRKISPLGKVPTLVTDDGTVIVESAVINEYLEEQFPEAPLLPATAVQRARARMVTEMTDAYIFARYLPLFALAKTRGKESPLVEDGMEGLTRV
ncbi:MAG: glutathione S-transferase family protein [Gammaproteobacteria bacterium]